MRVRGVSVDAFSNPTASPVAHGVLRLGGCAEVDIPTTVVHLGHVAECREIRMRIEPCKRVGFGAPAAASNRYDKGRDHHQKESHPPPSSRALAAVFAPLFDPRNLAAVSTRFQRASTKPPGWVMNSQHAGRARFHVVESVRRFAGNAVLHRMGPLLEHSGDRKGSFVDTVDRDAHVSRAGHIQHALPFGDRQRRVDPRREGSRQTPTDRGAVPPAVEALRPERPPRAAPPGRQSVPAVRSPESAVPPAIPPASSDARSETPRSPTATPANAKPNKRGVLCSSIPNPGPLSSVRAPASTLSRQIGEVRSGAWLAGSRCMATPDCARMFSRSRGSITGGESGGISGSFNSRLEPGGALDRQTHIGRKPRDRHVLDRALASQGDQ